MKFFLGRASLLSFARARVAASMKAAQTAAPR
jgi:hypothetical protein